LELATQTLLYLFLDDADGVVLHCEQSPVCQVYDVLGDVEQLWTLQGIDLVLYAAEPALYDELHNLYQLYL
jgi:hypothetical protein